MNDDELDAVTTRHTVHPCPTCGAENDAATHISGEYVEPADGDVSICSTCAALMIFTVGPLGTTTRVPTPSESAELSAHPEVLRVQAVVIGQNLD